MWEFILLTFFIVIGFGVAYFMASKFRSPVIIQQAPVQTNNQPNVDIESLVTRLVSSLVKEVADEVAKKINQHQQSSQEVPDIDKVIPIAIETVISEMNLEEIVKEEITIDKNLENSKNKLAEFLKGKK